MSITLFNESERAAAWLPSDNRAAASVSDLVELVEAFALAFSPPEFPDHAAQTAHYARCWALAKTVLVEGRAPNEAARLNPAPVTE